MVLHFCYLFSYPSLLELHYRGRLRKFQTAKEQAREAGLSTREAEHRIDTELFLNKYPQWELGTPHQSVILHKMFLHAAKWGKKEQKGSSAKATRTACGDQTWRQTNLPWNFWGTGPLTRRSRTSTTVFICWEGPQVSPLVSLNREGKQSATSPPP